MTIIRQFVQHTIKIFVKRVFHWPSAGGRGLMVYNSTILDTIVGIVVDESKAFQGFDWDPGRLSAGVGICGVDRRRIVHDTDVAVR